MPLPIKVYAALLSFLISGPENKLKNLNSWFICTFQSFRIPFEIIIMGLEHGNSLCIKVKRFVAFRLYKQSSHNKNIHAYVEII